MFTIELSILLVGATAGLIGLDYYVLPYVKSWWAQREQVTTGIGVPHGRLPRPVH